MQTNSYYFGARYYNSWSGQWEQVDPSASKYPSWSPYNYTVDNPINLIDPNGAYSYTIDGVPIDQGLGADLMQQYQQENVFLNQGSDKKNQQNQNTQQQASGGNSRDQNKPMSFDEFMIRYMQMINSIVKKGAKSISKAEANFPATFQKFSDIAVPTFDALGQNVAFWGSLSGGVISLSGDPLGPVIFESSNAFTYGTDITTASITGVNAIMNPSTKNRIDFGFHAINIVLDLGLTPVLKALGEKTLLKELFETTPIKSQLWLP